ncbi:hypothetical protein vseg_016122 [Gypsophila vaccaria]
MEDPMLLEFRPLMHYFSLDLQSLSTVMTQGEVVRMLITPLFMSRGLHLDLMNANIPLSDFSIVNLMDRHQTRITKPHAIRVMTWNVQGAGNQAFLTMLHKLIRAHKPHILALFKTHISGHAAQNLCDYLKFRGRTRVETERFKGGIWLFWHPDFVTVNPLILHEQHISVEVKRSNQVPWILSAVYASPDTQKREEWSTEIQTFGQSLDKPWMLAGDFNDTRSLNERNGNSYAMRRRCEKFNHWIENNELLELDYSGPTFTWARGYTPETRK